MSGFSEPEIGTGPVGNPRPADKSEVPKSATLKTIEALEQQARAFPHDPDPEAGGQPPPEYSNIMRMLAEVEEAHRNAPPKRQGFVPGYPRRVYRAAA